MLGFSLGEYDGTMFNISALIETNKAIGNGFYLNGKAWFGRKFGLGVSYRSQEVSRARTNKLIPMAEFQVSEAIRLGASTMRSHQPSVVQEPLQVISSKEASYKFILDTKVVATNAVQTD